MKGLESRAAAHTATNKVTSETFGYRGRKRGNPEFEEIHHNSRLTIPDKICQYYYYYYVLQTRLKGKHFCTMFRLKFDILQLVRSTVFKSNTLVLCWTNRRVNLLQKPKQSKKKKKNTLKKRVLIPLIVEFLIPIISDVCKKRKMRKWNLTANVMEVRNTLRILLLWNSLLNPRCEKGVILEQTA